MPSVVNITMCKWEWHGNLRMTFPARRSPDSPRESAIQMHHLLGSGVWWYRMVLNAAAAVASNSFENSHIRASSMLLITFARHVSYICYCIMCCASNDIRSQEYKYGRIHRTESNSENATNRKIENDSGMLLRHPPSISRPATRHCFSFYRKSRKHWDNRIWPMLSINIRKGVQACTT